ncbi:hypothetical protein EAH87_08445 [Sphingomonas koreensis]|nr:hypothetical protein EAH87_08445 [Sphingomonas koreensis]
MPLLTLAACGGGAVNTIGSITPPASTEPAGDQTFLDVTSATTFNTAAGVQSLTVDADTGSALYAGDASTATSPNGTVTYDPRDGIFTLVLSDAAANVSQNLRYQDPAHRTDFASLEVPDYDGYNYLTSGSATDSSRTADTFFYQRPGTTTSYVTLAGFVHTEYDSDKKVLTNVQNGAMVFGSETPLLQVPTSGSGHFDGDFLATMVNGQTFSWLNGSSSIDVDFAK